MIQHTHFRSPRRLQHAVCSLCTALILLTVASGCDSSAALQRKLTQKTIAYEIHPTEYNLTDLAHSYGELLESQLGDTIYPGSFAEYGVALALLGKNSEANRMFNNEVFFYPNSARYVRQLKLQLVPEYISDTVCDTSTIYVIELEPEEDAIVKKPMTAKDSIQQAKALQRQKREEVKRQQAEAKKKQAEERELIKSIRAKEKEQRDQDRANAKEAKEQAKKVTAKQKKEAAKQKEREKEAAAKAKAEQRAREKESRRQQQESDDE